MCGCYSGRFGDAAYVLGEGKMQSLESRRAKVSTIKRKRRYLKKVDRRIKDKRIVVDNIGKRVNEF